MREMVNGKKIRKKERMGEWGIWSDADIRVFTEGLFTKRFALLKSPRHKWLF